MPNDLTPDLARKIEELRGQVVPEGPAPTGASLRVTGQSPFRYAWSSDPEGQIIPWHGNPNGELNAWKGRLAVDVDGPALYQNTDGATTWVAVGGGTVTFPIIFDNGTYTYTIEDGGGNSLLLTASQNSNPTNRLSRLVLEGGGNISLEAGAGSGSRDLSLDATRHVNIEPVQDVNATPGRDFLVDAGRNVTIKAASGQVVAIGDGVDTQEVQVSSTDSIAVSSEVIAITPTSSAGSVTLVGLSGGKFAIFDATPVAQQATPVTLGDVISLLTAYGFCP